MLFKLCQISFDDWIFSLFSSVNKNATAKVFSRAVLYSWMMLFQFWNYRPAVNFFFRCFKLNYVLSVLIMCFHLASFSYQFQFVTSVCFVLCAFSLKFQLAILVCNSTLQFQYTISVRIFYFNVFSVTNVGSLPSEVELLSEKQPVWGWCFFLKLYSVVCIVPVTCFFFEKLMHVADGNFARF